MLLKRHRPIFALKLRQRHHINRVPRTAFEESAIGTFAGAKFAPDAQQGIDDNPPEWRMIEVRRPIHAFRNRAVLDACRRPGTPGAALIDYGKNVRLALTLSRRARGNRLVLDDRSCLKLFNTRSAIRHENPPTNRSQYILADSARVVNLAAQ